MNRILPSIFAAIVTFTALKEAAGEEYRDRRSKDITVSVAQGDIPFCASMPIIVQRCPDGQSIVVVHEAAVDDIDGVVLCIDRKFMCVADNVFTSPFVVSRPNN